MPHSPLLPRLAAGLILTLLAGLPARADLRSVVDPVFPPQAFTALSGEMQGFQIDLGKALAEELAEPVSIDQAKFVAILPALQAGTYDFVLAPVTVNAERARNLLFTEAYLYTSLQFGIRKGGAPITSVADLKGKTVAVNEGSNYAEWAAAHAEAMGFKVLALDSFASATQAVLVGRADAQLGGSSNIRYAAVQIPQFQADFEMVDTRGQWALALAKGNVALRDRLDRGLECLKASGKLAAISEKWFGAAPGPDAAERTPFPGRGPEGFEGYDPRPGTGACRTPG